MSAWLVLIGGDSPDAPLAWVSTDAQGRAERTGMSERDPLPAATPARTVLVIPAADAHVKRLELPARSEAQARAGAEALFGGKLAGGEKTLYAVGAPQNATGARLVAAIAEARLEAWLTRCRDLRAEPNTVLLDCTAWPVEDEIAIVATPNRVIVAGGAVGGFSIEPMLAPRLTARWLNDAQAEQPRLVLFGGDAALYREALHRELEARPAVDVVSQLAFGAINAPAFAPNLRQGAFAAPGARPQPLKFWRFAAFLAVAAVLLQAGAQVISGLRDRHTAAQIEAAAERDFRAARPDVRRISNLRAQVAAIVNAQQQAARHPVLVTSEPIVRALRQQPAVRLDEVRHEAPSQDVRIVVTGPDQPTVDTIALLLRDADLGVEVRAARPREGRAAAELLVSAP